MANFRSSLLVVIIVARCLKCVALPVTARCIAPRPHARVGGTYYELSGRAEVDTSQSSSSSHRGEIKEFLGMSSNTQARLAPVHGSCY